MSLDPLIYAAKLARRKAVRQQKRFIEPNAFHNANTVAGPSRISMPPPSNPQTPSQILGTSSYYFPNSPRGGAVMHSLRGRRARTSRPPTPPETLPLQNLSNQLRQESPRLQNRIRRQFDQLSRQTPTSRDHHGKRTRIPQPASRFSPARSERSMGSDDSDSRIQPQRLFQGIPEDLTGAPSNDAFRPTPMNVDEPPPTPTPSPPSHTYPDPPSSPRTQARLNRAVLGSPGRRNQARGPYGKQPHPAHPDFLWCTKKTTLVTQYPILNGLFAM
ncbi:hypothetical protein DFH09DRAFT_1081980 [Mycena vulgaris]|nr:hypothetical protein DFH09DRAFT_1081980 [Mycena vulgaris]